MTGMIKRLLLTVYAGVAVVVLSFGTVELLSAAVSCTEPGQIGTCPPYTDETCAQDCDTIFGTTGICTPAGCCQCQV